MARYATAVQMEAKYSVKDLAELTDVNGVTIDTVRINQALDDASNEIDTYLMGRYALPLVEVPAVLVGVACAIAMYNLSALRAGTTVDDVRNRYKDAIAFLTKVSSGTAQLGVSTTDSQPAIQTDGPSVITSTRTFDRDAMKGF